MADNIKDLKRRIKSIESTQHITNAMKLVSSAKFKKAKNVYDRTDKQLGEILDAMRQLFTSGHEIPPKYVYDKNKEYKNTVVIHVTSNRGLCGGFNGNLNRTAMLNLFQYSRGNMEVFAIGSRGRDFFRHQGVNITGEYLESLEKITFDDVKEISVPILERFDNGEIDQVILIYTAYINSLRQEPVVKRVLPLQPEVEFFADSKEPLQDIDIEFFPSADSIIKYILPKYVEIKLFQALIESAASENAARRTAMENATNNANDILGKLSLTYNRVRQAQITGELIEIISGANGQK